jgi:hypothetical protein
MKKTYLNPETQVTAMMPQSIICASGGGEQPQQQTLPIANTPGTGLGGD